MIRYLESKYINDIATAHLLAWQKGFKNILSDQLLEKLRKEDFISNWEKILLRKGRTNLIFVEKEKAVGFVSFGKPYEDEEADMEIYGIYVHPDYWHQKIGYQLMKTAISKIKNEHLGPNVILWVMSKNIQSRNFYTRFGFSLTTEKRISTRNKEDFEEVKYLFL